MDFVNVRGTYKNTIASPESIIAPNLDYCSVVWDTCLVIEKETLQVPHNRFDKIINLVLVNYNSATEVLPQLDPQSL